MDDNYQPQYQQPQFQQPQYQQPNPYNTPRQAIPAPAPIASRARGVFGKALASLLIPPYPILSLICYILGSGALKDIEEIEEYCASIGCDTPGILKAARVLGKLGKGFGIAFTIIWSLIVVLYALTFILIICVEY